MKCPQIKDITVPGKVKSLRDTEVDISKNTAITIMYNELQKASQVKYINRDELSRWIKFNLYNEYWDTLEETSKTPNYIHSYQDMADQVVVNLTGNLCSWPVEFLEFLRSVLSDFMKEDIPMVLMRDMFETGISFNHALTKNTWFNSQIEGVKAKVQLREVEDDGGYTLICFAYIANEEGSADYNKVLFSCMVSREAISAAYASFLQSQNKKSPQILRLFSETVQGDIDGVESIAVDANKFVGLAISYNHTEDQSTLSYCDKKELEQWYERNINSDKNTMLHEEESEDGDWSKAYEKLCEITTLQILGSSNGWCMDLARFYSELLWGVPASYIEGMFREGLMLCEVLEDNVWYDTMHEGKLKHVHLSKINGSDPVEYLMSVYGFYVDSEDMVDYEDKIYEIKVTEVLIQQAYKKYEDNLGRKKETVAMGDISPELLEMLDEENMITDVKKAKEAIAASLGVSAEVINEKQKELEEPKEKQKSKKKKKSGLVKKLRKAQRAINDVLEELGE